MVKDFLGQPLIIGDSVIYLHRTATSAFYIKGKVVDFIPYTAMGNVRYLVQLNVDSTKGNTSMRIQPGKIIRYNEETVKADTETRTKYIEHLEANQKMIEKVRAEYEIEYQKQLSLIGIDLTDDS